MGDAHGSKRPAVLVVLHCRACDELGSVQSDDSARQDVVRSFLAAHPTDDGHDLEVRFE